MSTPRTLDDAITWLYAEGYEEAGARLRSVAAIAVPADVAVVVNDASASFNPVINASSWESAKTSLHKITIPAVQRMVSLIESQAAQLADLSFQRDFTWRPAADAQEQRAERAEAQLAERDAELAVLKAHAEAICLEYYRSWSGDLTEDEFNAWPAIAAYRAAHPKEGT